MMEGMEGMGDWLRQGHNIALGHEPDQTESEQKMFCHGGFDAERLSGGGL